LRLLIVVPYFSELIESNERGLATSLVERGIEVTIVISRALIAMQATFSIIRGNLFCFRENIKDAHVATNWLKVT